MSFKKDTEIYQKHSDKAMHYLRMVERTCGKVARNAISKAHYNKVGRIPVVSDNHRDCIVACKRKLRELLVPQDAQRIIDLSEELYETGHFTMQNEPSIVKEGRKRRAVNAEKFQRWKEDQDLLAEAQRARVQQNKKLAASRVGLGSPAIKPRNCATIAAPPCIDLVRGIAK